MARGAGVIVCWSGRQSPSPPQDLYSPMGIDTAKVRLAMGSTVRSARVLLVVAALFAMACGAQLVPTASSHSAGIVGQTRNGCTCHNATESTAVVPAISGLPGLYEAGRTYTLHITVGGGTAPGTGAVAQGGFDLSASAGALLVPEGSATVRVDPATREATHTPGGSTARNWTVEWRAPAKDTGEVTLTLVVNTVNGDGVQMPGDSWGRTTLTTEPSAAGGVLDVPSFWKVLGVAVAVCVVVGAIVAVSGPRISKR